MAHRPRKTSACQGTRVEVAEKDHEDGSIAMVHGQDTFFRLLSNQAGGTRGYIKSNGFVSFSAAAVVQ